MSPSPFSWPESRSQPPRCSRRLLCYHNSKGSSANSRADTNSNAVIHMAPSPTSCSTNNSFATPRYSIVSETGNEVRVIFGGNDGILVTIDGAGHIHVYPPQGPGDPEVRQAA